MMFKAFVLLAVLISTVHCDPRVRFLFYFGTDFIETVQYNVRNLHTILTHPKFQLNRRTILFHYGSGQSISTIQVNDVIVSYLFNRQYNLIVTSYEDNNIIGTNSALELSEGIATALIQLFNAGYNSGSMNLLGFSHGAQILARSSRLVQSRTNRRHIIGRLTGLDPFNFIATIRIGRLNSADAQWVESIHTENPNLGDHRSTGHVQFFFNGGVSQPQCTSVNPLVRWRCSHDLALEYWAESVRSSVAIFPALQCDSWENYTSGSCNRNSVGHVGRTTQSNLRGSYFLRTNLQPPYARNTAMP